MTTEQQYTEYKKAVSALDPKTIKRAKTAVALISFGIYTFFITGLALTKSDTTKIRTEIEILNSKIDTLLKK